MTSKLVLRLALLIQNLTDPEAPAPPGGRKKITLNLLLREINECNRAAGTGCHVTYRTLRGLQRGEWVGVKKDTLTALVQYFPELKLQPMFVVPGLLEAFDAETVVAFMLGAKPRPTERRNDVSHWDALSHAVLLTECSKLDLKHEFQTHYVFWRRKADTKAVKGEKWHQLLEADECSVVSIGSPLVSFSSEVMLATMFGVKPFTRPELKLGLAPFYYVWRPQVAKGFSSAFGLTAEQLTAHELKNSSPALAAEVYANRANAFVLEGQIHLVPVKSSQWIMHGIIAAQRRASGNVWLVVSGLAGPATYAAARKVTEILDELPWSKGKASDVLWMPVKTTVFEPPGCPHEGDVREVKKAEFDGPARIWDVSKVPVAATRGRS